ncbi:MAG: LuxR C-terminal-related transcriptional regulator [Bacteroidales bacterium]|nr:LuxR C-terminal-related transcriptional regulator [Bacteroidales bacterium]
MKKIFVLILILYLLTACSRGGGDPYFLWSKTDPEFDEAVRRMEIAYANDAGADTLELLTLRLDSLARCDAGNRLKAARAALFMARYYIGVSSYAETWSRKGVEAIAKAKENYRDSAEYPYDMFRLRYIEGKMRPRSLEQYYFDNVRTLQEAREFGDSLSAAGALNNIGYVNLHLGDSIAALTFFNLSRQTFHQLGLERWERKLELSLAQANETHDIALSDSLLADLESYAAAKRDTLLLTIVLHNRFGIHSDIKYFRKALPLVEGKPGYAGNEALYRGLIAGDMLKRGDLDSAVLMARTAQQMVKPSLRPEYASSIYRIYASVLEREGKLDSALVYFHRGQEIDDSVARAKTGQDVIKRIAQMKIRRSEQQALRDKMFERTLYASLTVVILFLAMTVIFILLRRHNNMRMEKMAADLQLTRNQLQLASSLAVVKENENAIDTTVKTITELMETGRIPAADGVRVCSALRTQLSNREELDTFQQVYANVHPDFVGRLMERVPRLSIRQQRLATYIAMGMDNRQIARVMNISYASVMTARYRLRSCLGLSKTDSLEALLQRLADDKPENAV